MKNRTSRWLALGVALVTTGVGAFADDKNESADTLVCPISGEQADAKHSFDYESNTYRFCCKDCLAEFKDERSNSLYERIGGKAALHAAVDLFYVKVLADDRVSFFFDDINMSRQIAKQKEFLAAALGGPEPWAGKDMRQAHKNLDLKEEDFSAISENLLATLQELKLDKELITEVMTVVASTKDDVLNR